MVFLVVEYYFVVFVVAEYRFIDFLVLGLFPELMAIEGSIVDLPVVRHILAEC